MAGCLRTETKNRPRSVVASRGQSGGRIPSLDTDRQKYVFNNRHWGCMMSSISRSKIYKKVGGDCYVPFRGFVQKLLPVFIRDAIEALPPSDALLGHTQIRGHIFTAPSLDDFCKTLHSCYYGILFQQSQGILFQCIVTHIRGKCTS